MDWQRLLAMAIVITGLQSLPDAVSAQGSYRCSVGGRAVISDRPCAPGASTELRVIGPTYREPPPSRQLVLPQAGPAQDHLKYLNPDCAELSEAIRTASARGVGHATVADLRKEYQAKCREEDRLARQKHADAQADGFRAEREARDAKAQARVLSQREREQCHELLRILHGRRQRAATMTPGEQADLQRFEESYVARCKG